ncbi:MAG: DUF4115 domain-containing protein [Propionivibrio sp.]
MSEEKFTADHAGDPIRGESEGVPEDGGINVGLQLRTARESRGISVDEVSSALKLSPRQVEALEANDWSRLPKTIIRGFVRNYARFLDLDAGSLMAALDGMTLPQGPELKVQVGSPVSMPKEGGADRRDYVRVFSGLIVLLLAILAYYLVPAETWRTTLDSIKEIVQTKKKVAEPATETVKDGGQVSALEVPAATAVAVSDAPAPADSTTVDQPTPTSAQPLPVSASPSSSPNTLVFTFSQPSWVEVRDRTGQIVFSQLSQAGSRREVNGQPPFSLVVGNSSHVALQYKGNPVDLSKRSKDDVARLTLE